MRVMPDQDKLKLGKGSMFVKSRIARLPTCEDLWEADFRAMPQPVMQTEAHYLGMVVGRKDGRLVAELTVQGKPTVNDLARLLADAMRRPLDANARRPKTIHLMANPRWRELISVLEELGVAVSIEKKLPKLAKTLPAILEELRMIERAKMKRPDAEQAKVETTFPSIARYVRGSGFIEIGDQDGFGFVVRAIGYGSVDFEDNRPETLSEAMAVLESGLERWFQEQGVETE